MNEDQRFKVRLLGGLALATMAVAAAMLVGAGYGRLVDELLWF